MSVTCANNAAPLVLPWTNVTVSQDGYAVARGIEMGIGNPTQVFSFRPGVNENNTFVFNIAKCGNESNSQCIGPLGGVYDPSKSSTFTLSIKDRWNGTEPSQDVDTGGPYVYFNDEAVFQENGTIYGLPLFTDAPTYSSTACLPLGINSSFIQAAVDAEVAPSKLWSLWTGSRSIDDSIDGMLIIGGYSSERVAGNFIEFPVQSSCPLYVNVANITYNTVNGSISLLSNYTERFGGCLEPFSNAVQLPQNAFNNFAKASGAIWNDTAGYLVYNSTDPPTGNMTISLSNGANEYVTTIPTSELFTQLKHYAADGTYEVTENELVVPLITNATAGYIPWIGLPFLTMNYLVVNYDQGVFNMAPAVRDNLGDSAGSVQTLCTPGPTTTSSPTSTSSTQTPTHTSAPASSSTSAAPVPTGHKSHTGAIAGGVVGGVLGLALIIGLLFYFMRRRKRNNEREMHHSYTHGSPNHAGAGYGVPGMVEAPKSGRMSAYTDTTRTEGEYNELPSPGRQRVGQWLSADPTPGASQQGEPRELGAGPLRDPDEAMMSPTSGPLDMPAHGGYQ